MSMDKLVMFLAGRAELTEEEWLVARIQLAYISFITRMFRENVLHQKEDGVKTRQVEFPKAEVDFLLGDPRRSVELEAAEGSEFYYVFPKRRCGHTGEPIKLLIYEPVDAPSRRYLLKLVLVRVGVEIGEDFIPIGGIGSGDLDGGLHYVCIQR
jgi:hypothetical protein